MKELENNRLRRLVADLILDKQVQEVALMVKMTSPARRREAT